jgi:diacylglycerol kinase (ATP)
MASPNGLFDLRRVWRAAGYSISGLKAALVNEAAFRQEMALFVLLAPLGLWLGRDGVERALLVGSLVLVLVVELLNSAVETAVNRIGNEPHELSGRAKDIASAAVFLSLLLVALVWVLVLFDRFG